MQMQSYPLSVNESPAANVIIDDQHIPFDQSTEWFRGKNVKNPNFRRQVNEYLMKHRLYEYSVTGTPKPTTISLNDIFISVKTTKLYHDTRLDLIIKTWFQLATDQVSENSLLSLNSNQIINRATFAHIYSVAIHFAAATQHTEKNK